MCRQLGRQQAGGRGEALRAYERCRYLLAEELGVSPSGPTEAAYVALLGDEPTSQPTSSSAAQPLPLPAALARVPGSFVVGRETEAEVLAAALKRVDAEGRQSVLVTGEPGVGKTALVAELARNAHSEGARVLYGRCDEDLGIAYQPFAQALGHWVEHCALAELESHVGRCGGVLARLVPSLSRRLPGMVAPPLTDAETDRAVLFEAVSDALVTASASAPGLMVLEDLHWASSPTLLLLRHLVSGVRTFHMLVVGTWRHSDVDAAHPLAATLADLRRHPGVGRVRLEGLDQAGVAAFVEAAGAGGDDPAGLAVDLHAHTAGNPFFVGEVLRHLGETVGDAPKHWLHDARAGVVQAPEGVVEVVGGRMSRLSPLSNRTLVLASVAGNEFDLAVVEAAADPADADRSLDGIEEAVRARLVEESASAGRYRFAHALVRQSLYGSLGRTRRARLHARVGEVLERLHPDDPPLVELAHHFLRAAPTGVAEKALDYALRLAEKESSGLAFELAEDQLRLAQELLATMPPSPERSRRELDVQLRLVSLLVMTSGYSSPEAIEAVTRMGDLSREVDDRVTVLGPLLYAGCIALIRGHIDTTRHVARQLFDIGEQAQDPRLLMGAYWLSGDVALEDGRLADARDELDRAIETADSLPEGALEGIVVHHPSITVRTINAMVRWLLGDHEESDVLVAEAVARARTGSPLTLVDALFFRAVVRALAADAFAVRQSAEEALHLSEKLGFPLYDASACVLRGWARCAMGELEEGVAEIEAALTAFRSTGTRMLGPLFLGLLADARRRAGQLDAALEAVEEALDDVEALGERFWEAELHRLRGEVLADGFPHRSEEALRSFERAVAVARAQGARALEDRAAETVARRATGARGMLA